MPREQASTPYGHSILLTFCRSEYGPSEISETAQANLSANLVSVMLTRPFAGTLLANLLGYNLGRKSALLIVAVIAFIGGILQGVFFGYLSFFYIAWLVKGLGLGGAVLVAPT